MELQACRGCARHVDVHEVSCPFCGVAVAEVPPRPMRAGRFARAAVFAGASLAGCDQGAKPAPREPVPAVKAPPEEKLTASRIVGTVRDTGGAPLAGAMVWIDQEHIAHTDGQGHFVLENLPPGSYHFGASWQEAVAGASQRRGNHSQFVELREPRELRIDVKLEIQDMPVAMPYGAPPRRYRMV